MKFAPGESQLDCAELLRASGDERAAVFSRLAERAAEVLHRGGYVAFRTGRLRLSVEESRTVAHELAAQLRTVLIGRGAPKALRLEIDKPQSTYVPEGNYTRTLLPHFDGQHCSYLTPSTLDDRKWSSQGREFGNAGYTTTPAHKLYQGIFLPAVGEGLSVTTYYDWLSILSSVCADRGVTSRSDDAEHQVATTARWLGDNLREALGRQAEHGCAYPSFAAMLGLSEPLWHSLSFHHAEADLSEDDRARYPEAVPLTSGCPCGRCSGDMARIFCHQVLMATGMNWDAFRARWEILMPGEQGDLIFGHNLTMLHGGLAGGAGRIIEPLCLVVDTPDGLDYEEWLAASWRRTLPKGV